MSIQFKSDWQRRALCGDRPVEQFQGGQLYNAKPICDACPVRKECLEHALASPWQPYGIWGGLSQKDVVGAWRTRHPRASCVTEVADLLGLPLLTAI